MHHSGTGLLSGLAICLSLAGPNPADAHSARPYRAYAVEVPDCGRILDDCVPVCDWRVPGGGWPLAACYNNVCYRQAGACEASRVPRPAGGRHGVRATADK